MANNKSITYSNPNCYARELKTCSLEKSGEHFISKSLLKFMEAPGRMKIQGPAWLPINAERNVSSKSLKSNVLCRKHNEQLSILDDTGLEFCRYLLNLKQRQKSLTVDYQKLERWMLKLLCGFGASSYLRGFTSWTPRKEWLDILFYDGNLGDGLGLYYLESNKTLTGKADELALWPVTTDDLRELVGIHFLLGVYTLLFLADTPGPDFWNMHLQNGWRPIYRPELFQITFGKHTNELNLQTNTGSVVRMKFSIENRS